MDDWKYLDIVHREHRICNPTSPAKFAQLIDLLRLAPGARVLEIATGKGEFITRLIEQYGAAGVAVDLSPYQSRDARTTFAARVPDADLTFLEMDGADYRPDAPASFDLTACLGASWIYQGHRGTLQALMGWTRSGGLVVVGEPYWRQDPDPTYLALAGLSLEMFGSHYQNMETGVALGLTPLYSLVSSQDDWDVYEGLHWYAGERYAGSHPDDPDVPELRQRQREHRQAYLRYGRDNLGWAIYLFQK